MIEAHALFKKHAEMNENLNAHQREVFSACIISATVGNKLDELTQAIRDLEKAVKGGLE